jgi:hypothetical protein
MPKSLLPCVLELWRTKVTNPKPLFEPVPADQKATQQSSTREVRCSICGVPVRLDQCKTDENGLAVHSRCYVEKVSERNGMKV